MGSFYRILSSPRYKPASKDLSYSVSVPTMSSLLYMILNEGGADDGGVETAKTAKRKKDTTPQYKPDSRGYNMSIYYIMLLYVYYIMYIGKAAGPVSYIFPTHPRCHTIILAINIIVYLCVLPDPYPSRARAEFNIIH